MAGQVQAGLRAAKRIAVGRITARRVAVGLLAVLTAACSDDRWGRLGRGQPASPELPLEGAAAPRWDSLFNRAVAARQAGGRVELPEAERLGHRPQHVLGYAGGFSAEGGAVRLHAARGLLGEGTRLVGYRVLEAVDDRQVAAVSLAPPVDLALSPCHSFYGGGCRFPAVATLDGLAPGFYYALLRDDAGAESHPVHFHVPAATASPVALMLPEHTWQAYNYFGGGSLYGILETEGAERVRQPADELFSVSADRPLIEPTDYHGPAGTLALARALRAAGIEPRLISNRELHLNPRALDGARVLVIGTHDEYWTAEMRRAIDAFVAAGGGLAYFGGNACWWQIRLEGTDLYKDRSSGKLSLGFRRHAYYRGTGRFDFPAIAAPPQRLFGVAYKYAGYPVQRRFEPAAAAGQGLSREQYERTADIRVLAADHPLFEGTGFKPGDTWGGELGLLDVELDGVPVDAGGKVLESVAGRFPRRLEVLATGHGFNAIGYREAGGKRKGLMRVGLVVDAVPDGARGRVLAFGSIAYYRGLAAADPIATRIFLNAVRLLSGEPRAAAAAEAR